ncbi:MAG: hypothetical protein IPJ34_43395 [Myxococcales bacterium]|nr:hypothetical protein [Myxococcales bacterium]
MRALLAGSTVAVLGTFFVLQAQAQAPVGGGVSVSVSATIGAPGAPPPATPAPAAPPPGPVAAPAAPPPPPPPPPPPADRRRAGEIWVGLGFGNAVCDDKKPKEECVVDKAGAALDLGGAWRFHPHWAIGAEFGFNGFNANQTWKSTLPDPSISVRFSGWYLAPTLRWYWFGRGVADPYLQVGLGLGGVSAHAEDGKGGVADWRVTGWTLPMGIGVEFYVAERFRLGPQLQTWFLRGTKACDTTNGSEACRDARSEERMLAWRFSLQGTFGL